MRENELKSFLTNEAVFTVPEFFAEDLLSDSMTWRRRADGISRGCLWPRLPEGNDGQIGVSHLGLLPLESAPALRS